MQTKHLVVIGDCRSMAEIEDESIQLIITSSPYFNVKDYGAENIGSIDEYETYLKLMSEVFKECYRVLEDGRYFCINICDVVSGTTKYPIPCHYVGMLQKAGFEYRDDIIWKKAKAGSKYSSGAMKRFGVFVQNPYPMYYFPNNTYEHILIFRKGKFDYKKISKEEKKTAKLDLEYVKCHWNNDIWEMSPQTKNSHTKDLHPAMFPEPLPEAFIKLFTYEGETVLDPFLGSGTTSKVAGNINRNSIGYEINHDYLETIKSKIGYKPDSSFRIIIRKPRGVFYED